MKPEQNELGRLWIEVWTYWSGLGAVQAHPGCRLGAIAIGLTCFSRSSAPLVQVAQTSLQNWAKMPSYGPPFVLFSWNIPWYFRYAFVPTLLATFSFSLLDQTTLFKWIWLLKIWISLKTIWIPKFSNSSTLVQNAIKFGTQALFNILNTFEMILSLNSQLILRIF